MVRETTAAEEDPASGTKLQITEAALRTVRAKGYAGASARAIAREGSFNQALIFYHHGSLRALLLAVLDLISERRMLDYGEAFEAARSPGELVALARRIHSDDLERGYVTVLGEMVSGGLSDPELGRGVAERIDPWIAMVERKAEQLLEGTPLGALVPPRDLAYGLVAAYFGIDMLSHLQGDPSRSESLLDLAERLSAMADLLLPTRREESR